jgi:hypothetical protein
MRYSETIMDWRLGRADMAKSYIRLRSCMESNLWHRKASSDMSKI